jgi:hypothetical protein
MDKGTLALEQILAQGDPALRWRAERLMGGKVGPPPTEVIARQNPDGGARCPFAATAMSSMGATSRMLCSMAFWGMGDLEACYRGGGVRLETPATRRAMDRSPGSRLIATTLVHAGAPIGRSVGDGEHGRGSGRARAWRRSASFQSNRVGRTACPTRWRFSRLHPHYLWDGIGALSLGRNRPGRTASPPRTGIPTAEERYPRHQLGALVLLYRRYPCAVRRA